MALLLRLGLSRHQRCARFRRAVGGLLIAAGVASSSVAEMIPATPAKEFLDRVGVNTHLQWIGTNYDRLGEIVIDAIADGGFRLVRDTIDIADFPEKLALATRAFEEHGLRFSLIAGPGDPAEDKRRLDLWPKGAIWGVEGANEPGIMETKPVAALRAADHISGLAALIRADAAYDDVLILGPSYVTAPNVRAAGDLSGSIDLINIHPYPGAEMPEAGALETAIAYAARLAPARPAAITETGYHTLPTASPFKGVTERALSIYGPRVLVESLLNPAHDVRSVFLYEMLQNGAASKDDFERWFGLLDLDGAPRPHFLPIRALLRTIADSEAAAPSTVEAALSGENPDVRLRALSRSTEEIDLLLWRAAPVFDPETKVDLDVPDVFETIRLAPNWLRAEAMRINETPRRFQGVQISPEGAVDIPVGPDITILRLTPAGKRDGA